MYRFRSLETHRYGPCDSLEETASIGISGRRERGLADAFNEHGRCDSFSLGGAITHEQRRATAKPMAKRETGDKENVPVARDRRGENCTSTRERVSPVVPLAPPASPALGKESLQLPRSGTASSRERRPREPRRTSPSFREKLARGGRPRRDPSQRARGLDSTGRQFREMRAPWLVLILTEILDLVPAEALRQDNRTVLTVPGQRSAGIHSRRRRQLAFPKGSAFVVTLSLLKAIQVTEPANWNLDLEFDMIWPIPSQEDLRDSLLRKGPSAVKRRHRREIYANFELALDSQNLPGRRCVLRAICEARSLLSPPGFSLVEDLLRVILRNAESGSEIDRYDTAYRTRERCDAAYACPFSLLQFLLMHLYSGVFDQ